MLLFLVSLVILIPIPKHVPEKINSTVTLVEAMQKKYSGKWAKTITFVQHNIHYGNDTVKNTSVWYEAIEYPDKFRIDFGKPVEGNAVIFANDSVFNFKSGQLKSKRSQPNNLMLLAGGIYFLSGNEALQRLKQAGYDTSKFHEATWLGKRAYVVGAEKGDLQAAQFWIDKEHLYLVRTLTPDSGKKMQEARFSKHIKTAGGWTETEVLFLSEGKKQQLEEYKDIQADSILPQGLFNADFFGKVHWMK